MTWRDLLTWIEAHRATMAEHAGAMAECALWIRGGSVLDAERAATRCERIAFEIAAALEALEHVHPRDPQLDEDTQPGIEGASWGATRLPRHALGEPPREPPPYREERKKRGR